MKANLLKYMCAQNYQNRERFDKDIAKIKQCSFLPHMVYRYTGKIPAQSSSEHGEWPKHVLRLQWLPVNDLLGHVNTKLVIYHCGANSQFEVGIMSVYARCSTFVNSLLYA